MHKLLIPLATGLLVLAGCSKPPEVAGLYTKKATLGRHGGTAEIEWDFRSDGSARYYAHLDFAEPVPEGDRGGTIKRMLQWAGGNWKRVGKEVVFSGQMASANDSSGDDLKSEIAATFKIEPNGDLIGVSGDVPWLPEDRWYPMRYAKQR